MIVKDLKCGRNYPYFSFRSSFFRFSWNLNRTRNGSKRNSTSNLRTARFTPNIAMVYLTMVFGISTLHTHTHRDYTTTHGYTWTNTIADCKWEQHAQTHLSIAHSQLQTTQTATHTHVKTFPHPLTHTYILLFEFGCIDSGGWLEATLARPRKNPPFERELARQEQHVGYFEYSMFVS